MASAGSTPAGKVLPCQLVKVREDPGSLGFHAQNLDLSLEPQLKGADSLFPGGHPARSQGSVQVREWVPEMSEPFPLRGPGSANVNGRPLPKALLGLGRSEIKDFRHYPLLFL